MLSQAPPTLYFPLDFFYNFFRIRVTAAAWKDTLTLSGRQRMAACGLLRQARNSPALTRCRMSRSRGGSEGCEVAFHPVGVEPGPQPLLPI